MNANLRIDLITNKFLDVALPSPRTPSPSTPSPSSQRPSSAIDCDQAEVNFSTGRGRDAKTIRAIDGVDIHLPAGQITSLVGPSGCGKTTLLRVIAGLQRTTQGSVRLRPGAESELGEIAFVFQQPALLPWCSAIENVMLPLELIGKSRRQDRLDAAREILEIVELTDAMDRLPSQLSGGMQMRVSIARALVTSPRVLLLDEPFAALDDMLRTQLGELLLSLWDQRRFTAVMVTHNIAEAVLLSHQVVVMRDGRCDSPLANPLEFPRSDYVRRTPRFGSFYGQVSDQLRGSGSTPASIVTAP